MKFCSEASGVQGSAVMGVSMDPGVTLLGSTPGSASLWLCDLDTSIDQLIIPLT